jgi:hypothetical protein
MNHKAIYALYPQVVTVDDGAGAFDAQGNKVDIDLASLENWKNPEEYKYLRAAEYPPMSDYLDAIVKGDTQQQADYIAACLAVKAKYPK